MSLVPYEVVSLCRTEGQAAKVEFAFEVPCDLCGKTIQRTYEVPAGMRFLRVQGLTCENCLQKHTVEYKAGV